MRREGFAATALTADEVAPLGEVVLAERDTDGFDLVLELDGDTVAHVRVWRGRGTLAVATSERDALDQVTDGLLRCLRDPELPDGLVPVTFWSATAGGSTSTARRQLDAPAWQDVRDNYAPAAAGALDDLVAADGPGPGGLVLWHGAPGTGKSYALRVLARAWGGWCDTHVVTDPELFFGASTDYLISGLLRREERDRWRLFVVEDAGEYLAADARAVAGQALSRLLNLSDGLLGAGLRSLVLVTTNEPLRRMHPAVVRPGRTWAEVEFPLLPAAEANAWLEARGCGARVDHETSLAELFSLAGGRPLAARASVGFAS